MPNSVSVIKIAVFGEKRVVYHGGPKRINFRPNIIKYYKNKPIHISQMGHRV